MPLLGRLSDIYLRDPGTVDMHTLRGRIHAVVPARAREYRSGTVLTLILKDLDTDANPVASKAEKKNEEDSDEEFVLPASKEQQPEHLFRVFFYDDFASAVDFASVGDVLELRVQWRVFLNPDSDGGRSSTTVFHAGRQHSEHLLTTTAKTEVSVYSKEGEDVVELQVNPEKLKAEPVARIAHGFRM